MVAHLYPALGKLGTTYQRLMLFAFQSVSYAFTPTFGFEKMYLAPLMASGPYVSVTFKGVLLDTDLGGDPVGSVDSFVMKLIDGDETKVLAKVGGLGGVDLAALFDAGDHLTQGEPDFTDPFTALFYDPITGGRIVGTGKKDVIETGTEPVKVVARGGKDIILLGPGGGTITGTHNAIDGRNLTGGIAADLAAGTIAIDGAGSWHISGARALFGTPEVDLLTGGSGGDLIFGRGSADVIDGLGGGDILHGDDGDDSIYGRSGRDRLYGEAGDDYVSGGSADDRIEGGAGADTLKGGAVSDRILGGTELDTIDGGGRGDVIFGGDGEDEVHGGPGDDRVFGGGGFDTLYGDGGDDLIKGGDHGDTMEGGAGDDLLYGEAGDDIMFGGEDKDRLVGGDGVDTMSGGAGNDRLEGGAGNDKLFGNPGHDTMRGGTGDDQIEGDDGADRLFGQADNDSMRGGDGNDMINGGSGNDQMWGDQGDDRFVFAGAAQGTDQINDFADGDRIVLKGQSASDVVIAPIGGGYSVTHATGTITVLTTDPFDMSDIGLG